MNWELVEGLANLRKPRQFKVPMLKKVEVAGVELCSTVVNSKSRTIF
jgi:hypothetical protein